ncbi:MAG: alpha/beta hydrolase family protein [Bacteroidales bacterium]
MRKKTSIIKIIILVMMLNGIENIAIAQTQQAFLIGNWIGKIEFQGKQLALYFRVNYLSKDSVQAYMDSPDQGAKDIKVSKLTIKGDSVFIRVKSLGVGISGSLNMNDSSITAIFRQSIFNCPIILKKVEKLPQINRPQEPKPPYPYLTTEVSFENTAAKIEFSGTLTTPEANGKFPAVVMITGSGPQNRDEELLGHKPFLVIADYLSRNGIAVLRYDDRGIGKSKGNFSSATSFDFAADANAAVNYLKTLSNIDSNRIGIIGHSEGGLIAPIIASSNPSVRFIVLLAGPGLNGAEILLLQSALIAKADGETNENIKNARTMNKQTYRIINNEKDNTLAAQKISKAFDRYISKLPKEDGIKLESQKDMMIQQILTPWFRTFLSLDPKTYLQKTHCAVFALNGAKDLQVPADENLAAIEKYLTKAGNKNYQLQKLPNLNHLFQNCQSGSPEEYSKIEETFSPAALLMIKDWIWKIIK